MNTKNIPAETIKRIAGLEKKKADELEKITEQIRENNAALSVAKEEIQKATESTNLKEYTAAKAKEAEASAALEMYTARYAQIERREYVTQKDSDAVIDALLQYEKDIADEFIKTIAGPIEEIRKAHADYIESVKTTEHTIKSWNSRIRANYRSETTRYADGTNISKTPVPVHRLPYAGCTASAIVGGFLDRIGTKTESESK